VTSPEFRPAAWLRGRHGQTIVPALLPAREPGGEILDVEVAPGTSVRLVVMRPGGPATGTLVLFHGLAGSAASHYMRRTAAFALSRARAVVRVNLRSCGGTEAMSETLYNAGQSEDADRILAALEREGLPRPFELVGFSLGGNIVLRYAGLSGEACRADAVCGVNPPIDLAACLDALERPANAPYHLYFTREMCVQLRRIRKVRTVAGPPARWWSIGGVRRFDDLFTAPDAGYPDAATYYAAASAGPVLHGVRRPTLVLSASDDPLVPASMFEPFRQASPNVYFVHPGGGGHVGYWQEARPRYWAARALLEFFDSSRC
jgi:uncharacterized protein